MRYIIVFLYGFFLSTTANSAQEKEQINWKTWEELDQSLAKKPKPVFLFFEAEWCVYCKKIDRVAFKNPEVIKQLNQNYYAVRMDVNSTQPLFFDQQWFHNTETRSKQNAVHELAKLFINQPEKGITLPATLILDQSFRLKQRLFSYYTPKHLLNILSD